MKRSERAKMMQLPQGIDKFDSTYGHRRTKTQGSSRQYKVGNNLTKLSSFMNNEI